MKRKSMKLVAITAAILMVFACLAGCTSTVKKTDAMPNLNKIADNLYEITYSNDFNWGDTAVPTISGFACSAVQNGQYRGRNYDWVYADTDLCIVHSTVAENRPHASVGVADLSFIISEDGSPDYNKIPFKMVDGINDAGVCIQVNVMPYGENGQLNHSETAEDDLQGSCVVRYILDYADSVDMAIELLREKDIYSEMDTQEELHWMISGPTSKSDDTIETVVAEVFPDGLHITDRFVNEKPIMTNFNVSNFDGTPESIGVGFGFERWQLLNQYYEQANSVMGTFDLMKKVSYSNFYDLYRDGFWYSEYNGSNLCDYYEEDELKEILGEDTYDDYMKNFGGVIYTSALWEDEQCLLGDSAKAGILAPLVENDIDAYKAQNQEDGSLWITIHTSVYDLVNKTLDIRIREAYDHLHFTIN